MACHASKRSDWCMARGQGFEPRFSGPEPDVLPLDDPRRWVIGYLGIRDWE